MSPSAPTITIPPNTFFASTLIHITPLPSKGLGVQALKSIPPGTTLITESTYMRIPVPGHQLTEQHLTTAYSKLSPEDQTLISSLSANPHHEGSRLKQIFTSNTFGNISACWLHPTISRINHSCSPNCTTVDAEDGSSCQIISDRQIEAGDEITFSYNSPLYEITTTAQRRNFLQNQYGFHCCCTACHLSSSESDTRRLLIKSLRGKLDGLRTSDLSSPTSEPWLKEITPPPLPATERTSLNLLLAHLRREEGLSALAVAQNFWHAAEAMLEQIQALHTIVILSWARNVKAWMEEAISILDSVRSPGDDDAQMLREAWRQMQARPCMRVAMGFMDGSLEVHVKGWHRSAAFAIQIEGGKLKVLSRRECSAVLNGIVGSLSPVPQNDEPEYPPPHPSTATTNLQTTKPKWMGTTAKVLGAALTCAAPVAAYWIMR